MLGLGISFEANEASLTREGYGSQHYCCHAPDDTNEGTFAEKFFMHAQNQKRRCQLWLGADAVVGRVVGSGLGADVG